jgi:hypothetical protein
MRRSFSGGKSLSATAALTSVSIWRRQLAQIASPIACLDSKNL